MVVVKLLLNPNAIFGFPLDRKLTVWHYLIVGAGPPDKVVPKGGGLKKVHSELVNVGKS